ncbi:hypothetical protein NKH14_28780 [Mesorhizobium sp. M1380]|uniref:hypothetical protein n=1 Tax=Mesorhizobium sp. M1380 TaxID=2957093 RepID=UPI0033365F2E
MPFVPKEDLPQGEVCPPDDAQKIQGLFVRLIDAEQITDGCFLSWNARGRDNKKKVPPCLWAACSLVVWDQEWVDGPVARVKDFAVAARIPQKYGAVIAIGPDDGLAHRGSEESPHISFWMSKDFDPAAALVQIVSLA